jgi:ubiquinone/menaquinone biosynthesis C-methylase UbiE
MNYYDEISQGYEELHREEQEKKIALIKQYLKVSKNDILLDVGCGTGITTTPWNCIRFGIDPAKKLLNKAHPGPKYTLAKAENIPFEDNFFDIVVSITAIQNFSDIKKGLEEIKRVGKDNFVLTFLKKSPKKELILGLIKEIFNKRKLKIIEEEKDMIVLILTKDKLRVLD